MAVLLAGVGGPRELEMVLGRATSEKSRTAQRLRFLSALEEAARQRGLKPAGDLKAIVALLKGQPPSVRERAARLAGLWGVESARAHLLAGARDGKTPDTLRQAYLSGLAGLGGKASRDALDELALKGDSTTTRRMALVALAGLDLAQAARRATAVLAASKDGEGTAEVFDAFLQRKNGATLLAKALTGCKLPADVARVGVRTLRTSGRDSADLLDALTKAGGLKFGARTLSDRELKDMVADVARLGNAQRGERVFRRKDQLCLRCHAIGGSGGQVGPDLSSIGASAPVDYLIESLLLPSKAIKENYHALLVSTRKGRLFTGIKVRQTPTALILRTDQDKEIAIALKDIEEQTPSKASLMPDGLTDTLTRGELLDLVRFLSELGKVGPYSVGKARVARRWQVLAPTPEVRRALEAGGVERAMSNDPALVWEPVYSTVAGELPLGDVSVVTAGKDSKLHIVRTQIHAAAASKVRLHLKPATGVRLWLGNTLLPVKEVVELSLPAGGHTLTFAVERREALEALRCEVEDTPASAGVHFVAGK
jgi:putative heme-binding domain-containing protein